MTIIVFLLVLSVLVLVHEWGHFFVARKSGMKVHEFGLGFPPRAIAAYRDPKSKKWIFVKGFGKDGLKATVGGDERTEEYPSTLYSLNWLPLGGFVKIKGENGEDAGDADSFMSKSAFKRAAVLVAGVTMNFIFAAVLISIGLMSGLPADIQSLNDKKAIVIKNPEVLVQQVEKDSPADKAGLIFGDSLVEVNKNKIINSEDLTEKIQESKTEEIINLTIKRQGETKNIEIRPEVKDGINRIGVMLADVGVVRYPWYLAIYKGFVAAFFGMVTIFISFFVLIKNLILGQGLAFEVAGPVGIAGIVGQSAKMGFNYLLQVSAMISLSLAAINILPIPALDGGRLFFVILEKIIRRPIPRAIEGVAHTVGFVLLMVLILFITMRDIIKLF